MYATVIQTIATEQIKQHHASAAAASRAGQMRRARRRARRAVTSTATINICPVSSPADAR
jgi:hypothetical protein